MTDHSPATCAARAQPEPERYCQMIVDVQALAKRWNLPVPWLAKLVSEVLAEAAGSEPEVVGPTDEELLELWQGWNLGWDPHQRQRYRLHPLAPRPRPAAACGGGEKMKLYSAYQASSFIGKLINYQHIASDSICGPTRVVAVHAGSDQLIVSGDLFTGRTVSLLLCVTMLEPVLMSLTTGKVE